MVQILYFKSTKILNGGEVYSKTVDTSKWYKQNTLILGTDGIQIELIELRYNNVERIKTTNDGSTNWSS